MTTPLIHAYYEEIKQVLSRQGFRVNPYKEIQYGIQFLVFFNQASELLRVYQNKKGLRLDFSQCKDRGLATKIADIIDTIRRQGEKAVIPNIYKDRSPDVQHSSTDPTELIGVDESGKGDYFGPLVVAGVYCNPKTSEGLRQLGVGDSKLLTDKKIMAIAPAIMQQYPHSILSLANASYNDVYQTMKNLNHILAWGHAKVIAAVLEQQPCPNVLSDQFGHASLIKNALRAKGIPVTLYQRPRAESNIAVAAASVLARYTFVQEIKKMEEAFDMSFPKGCSEKTRQAAHDFSERYKKENLNTVAKLHFKLTEEL